LGAEIPYFITELSEMLGDKGDEAFRADAFAAILLVDEEGAF
jgi:hypothetical protein